MDRDEVRADLPAVRKAELDQAAEIIGYDEVVMLGYRDSGMPDSEANARPEAFANADFDEAVGRLVAEIRRTRPQVVITYGDEQQGYPHPDQIGRASGRTRGCPYVYISVVAVYVNKQRKNHN